jgi:predicted alpha/beta-hydrolase family hydrolase
VVAPSSTTGGASVHLCGDNGRMHEVPTPHGPARIHPEPVAEPRGVLVLGHSAGGGVDDPALRAAVDGAAAARVSALLVELPFRVAGRRPSPPAEADAAWLAVVEHVRDHQAGLPVVGGGRSYGGRVACRAATRAGSVGVVCLAFPLVPPYGRAPASRLPELDGVDVPVLVVQGDRDPYGCPPEAPGRDVVVLPGDHGLRSSLPAVTATVARWLDRLLSG